MPLKTVLRVVDVKIYVRRGGPNWQEGLNLMRRTAVDLDLPITVHGPDRVMTAIVCLALGKPLEEDVPTPPVTPGGTGSLQRRTFLVSIACCASLKWVCRAIRLNGTRTRVATDTPVAADQDEARTSEYR